MMTASIMLDLREFFFSFDNIVYTLAASIYDFMIKLAKLDLFTNLQEAQDAVNRIYIVVGVVVFFRILLSLVQAVVDPDKIGDKKQGTSSIITRTVIVLILIAIVPTIFNLAYKFQGIFIRSNIVYNVLNSTIGGGTSSLKSLECQYKISDTQNYKVNIYFSPDYIELDDKRNDDLYEDYFDNKSFIDNDKDNCPDEFLMCVSSTVPDPQFQTMVTTSTTYTFNSNYSCNGGQTNAKTSYKIISSASISIDNTGGKQMATTFLKNFIEMNEEYKDVDASKYAEVKEYLKNAEESGDFDAIEVLVSSDDYNCINTKGKSCNNQEKNIYSIKYQWFISTIAGGFLLGLLITATFDFALRALKMLFLQISSPIFISSYIQGSGKDTMFGRWLNEALKTYADIFVRIILIGFLMFCVNIINETFDDVGSGSSTSYYEKINNQDFALLKPIVELENLFISDVEAATTATEDDDTLDTSELSDSERGFLKFFLLIGALMFVKVGPKMIMGLFGVKSSGASMLNPFQKVREIPGVGKGVAALSGGAIGATKGALTGKGLKGLATGAAVGGKAAYGTVGWGGAEIGKKPQTSAHTAASKSLAEAKAGKVSGIAGQAYANAAFTARGGERLKSDIKSANISLNSLKAEEIGLNSNYQKAQANYEAALKGGNKDKIIGARTALINAGGAVRDNQVNQARLGNQIQTMEKDLEKVKAIAPGGLTHEDKHYDYTRSNAEKGKREYKAPVDRDGNLILDSNLRPILGPSATWNAGDFKSEDINNYKTPQTTEDDVIREIGGFFEEPPTPTPEPASTPEPSATPEPASTPEPSATPEPAPEPTPEPAPTPEDIPLLKTFEEEVAEGKWPIPAPEPASTPEPAPTPEQESRTSVTMNNPDYDYTSSKPMPEDISLLKTFEEEVEEGKWPIPGEEKEKKWYADDDDGFGGVY